MDQASYFLTHPPRCIAGFIARPTVLPDIEFDGHASKSQIDIEVPLGVRIYAPENVNIVFALFCLCGANRHFAHGYRWVDSGFDDCAVFLSPLVLECTVCGKRTQVIDTDLHGYDSELGHGSATARAEGEDAVFECANCGQHQIEAYVRFEYSDDLIGGDFPRFAGREQELFTWFNLIGKCSQCAHVMIISDFECS